jgi:hypothetical protein
LDYLVVGEIKEQLIGFPEVWCFACEDVGNFGRGLAGGAMEILGGAPFVALLWLDH